MKYEVVDIDNKVLAVFDNARDARRCWEISYVAYDFGPARETDVNDDYLEQLFVEETKAEPVVVVFWWRQDDVHHGWYGNKEFATLAEARAQYETWTKEGKRANYVAL